MGIFDFIIRVFASIETVVPLIIVCVVSAAVATVLLLAFGDMIWINQKRFKFYGIFYELSDYDCLRLAVSFLRLVMTIAIIIMFKEMAAIHFVIYAMEGIIFILDFRKPTRILMNLVWFVLQFFGMVAISILCGYIKSMMYAGAGIWVVYILLGLFITAFSCFIFLNEMDQISLDRRANIQDIREEKDINEGGSDDGQ